VPVRSASPEPMICVKPIGTTSLLVGALQLFGTPPHQQRLRQAEGAPPVD